MSNALRVSLTLFLSLLTPKKTRMGHFMREKTQKAEEMRHFTREESLNAYWNLVSHANSLTKLVVPAIERDETGMH